MSTYVQTPYPRRKKINPIQIIEKINKLPDVYRSLQNPFSPPQSTLHSSDGHRTRKIAHRRVFSIDLGSELQPAASTPRSGDCSVPQPNRVRTLPVTSNFPPSFSKPSKRLLEPLNDVKLQSPQRQSSLHMRSNPGSPLSFKKTSSFIFSSPGSPGKSSAATPMKSSPGSPLSFAQLSAVLSDRELPCSGHEAVRYHSDFLTPKELKEISEYEMVYYVGKRTAVPREIELTELNIEMNDPIAWRYEVLAIQGKGGFSTVYRAFDYKNQEMVALKIIRKDEKCEELAQSELRVLRNLLEHERKDVDSNIIHMKDNFVFRDHLCITFELMSINLYELMKANSFQGLSLNHIRKIAVEMLKAMRLLKRLKIIHCDFKPENICLKYPNRPAIKLIDFGSACYENEKLYTYVQSRYYRAPEIIFGIPYGSQSDLWAFGCILAELWLGKPLFPGENELECVQMMFEILDVPPVEFVMQSNKRKSYFDKLTRPYIFSEAGDSRIPARQKLRDILNCQDTKFVHFIQACLQWDPKTRQTVDDLRRHPFILTDDHKSSSESSLVVNSVQGK